MARKGHLTPLSAPLLCSPTVGIGMTSAALNGTGFLDMPAARCPPPTLHIPLPPLPPFLAPASLDPVLGWATWGQHHCLRERQKPLGGRRGEAECFTWSQPKAEMAASLCSPPSRPLLWLGGGGVTPVCLYRPLPLLPHPQNGLFPL